MVTILVILIVSMAIFVVLLLVIVMVGIRQEPPTEELSEQAPKLIAAFARRLLGLHVRKPDSLPDAVGRGAMSNHPHRKSATRLERTGT
jgi:hypothetical protein